MVSPATFAKVTGVSRQAVYKAIKDGRLDDALVDNGGKKKAMDLDKASKIWAATMAPRQLDPVRVAEVIKTPVLALGDFWMPRPVEHVCFMHHRLWRFTQHCV